MNILIIGVSGFIGHHLYDALTLKGHYVMGASRNEVPNVNWQKLDFNHSDDDFGLKLQNVDLAINAVGIYQQSTLQQFSTIHDAGPKKLFDACRKRSIKIIQISAIGAEQEHPVTDFLKSKRNADQMLLQSNELNVVLYPGIVLGEGGLSTRQLSLLAHLFCIPLVFGRNKKLPLISIHQITHRVDDIINNWPTSKMSQVLVAKPETMECLLNNLRRWMDLDKGCFIIVPKLVINIMFNLFPKLSIGAFNKQSINMLSSYSDKKYVPISDETASESLLKNKATENFKNMMKYEMLFYLNLMTLSVIWIGSGLASLINIEQSREIISLLRISGGLGETMIISAAIMDIFLGVLLCVPALRRWVITLQINVIIIYSIIISLFIPEFWLHPFAPIIKNGAMLVLALYLRVKEKE